LSPCGGDEEVFVPVSVNVFPGCRWTETAQFERKKRLIPEIIVLAFLVPVIEPFGSVLE